jgi:hypothetical protein
MLRAPSDPPAMSSGARTPPDVPEPRATAQMMALTIMRERSRSG